MPSQFPLTPIAEAQARLLAEFSPLTAESVPLANALGRVLAEEIISQIDLPAFANSSMDGFAVRAV
ncbi:MAG: molybdopterin molybdenumtransferase MoeA, partial [Chloroflexi bacterium]|nr:molybdopterin molybdenumtransferase MoeA [Chloroflexota bacterium]